VLEIVFPSEQSGRIFDQQT